jgi:diguanylate cyclase
MDNMRNHISGKAIAYEVEYRIQHKNGHYLWYYDRGTITKRDIEGKPLMIEGVVFDISESKRVEEKLRDLSERDTLTKTYNRRMFFEHLKNLQNLSIHKETPFSVLLIDIDEFKKINDTYGHLVGDEAIRTLVEVIRNEKRSEDKVYRYGGDEFLFS